MTTLDDLNRRSEYLSRAHSAVAFARCLAIGGNLDETVRQYYGRTPHAERIKAAVAIATTGYANLAPQRTLTDEFLELTRRRTILGRLTGYRPVPMNVLVPLVSTGTVAAWFLESGSMPATAMAFDLAALTPTRIGTLLGVSRELMRATSPAATQLLERDLQRAVIEMEDGSLLDDQAAVPLSRPAGLLFGLSAVGGGSPDSIETDIIELWQAVRSGDIGAPYFIASPSGGMFLATLRGTGGDRLFPDARPVDGGSIYGVPLVISKAAHANLVLVDASALAVADEGLEFGVSEQAAVIMDTAPSAPAAVVSGFQTNTSFIRIIRTLHWALGYDDGVAFIELDVPGSPV
jgi:HK97 family phage major capsid protein